MEGEREDVDEEAEREDAWGGGEGERDGAWSEEGEREGSWCEEGEGAEAREEGGREGVWEREEGEEEVGPGGKVYSRQTPLTMRLV